ncbi:serine/threonine/tyrosine-interacting-like protein 2 [Triplophysa rosa]|uniref:Inactive dual specificity phosphatase 27 n=1 Tax=Triplophysa rosa TaxID=992332 RepID=A0A9W7WZV7_TRIRA|nr:serine/threonine/tyrosine-interacting-like protein 2 [Triplophysa rosa]XP_057188821.1 serine/threonine/tyrosine-interacting-like protein 2 [Triplophysa rosa]XP_057188822.1 serine/threonine/tyrosine-interacting-like protein 2 [Triplophysa rosa]KAI7811448.1 putative inactive dual specificity phosphatase 27 [Triplophysa rosa]
MASAGESSAGTDQQDADEAVSVRDVQSHYLRCPSPSFSTVSDRFSMISGSDAESIFMEPIHLSSAIAAKKIISEELKSRDVRSTETSDRMMLETAEQLMVEDLYNRVKDMMDDRSPYNTPCVLDIQRSLLHDRLEAPFNPVDEVWPNVFISEKSVAVNKARLKRLGITHVVNAAHGTGVYTGQTFYQNMNVSYMGIEIDDFSESDMSPHFRSCAEFLDDALLTHRGKVLVNSMMGVSRSAVLVAAYLMIFQNMSVMEALLEIRKKRAINPNEGFLKQLRRLNETLMEERDEDDDDDTLSQCSVIDIRAHPDEEEQSVFGVKAESIMVEEEEDGGSVMSSVASSAAAMKAGILFRPSQHDLKVTSEDPVLPGEVRDDEDGDVGSMIREWQKRNEKYQNEDWWEAQLMCGDGESSVSEAPRPEDLESVTSEDVRMLKEQIRRRPRRAASDAGSTASCSSYSDLWKQRLKEIEEQAAARYRRKEADDDIDDEARQKKIEDDAQSIMSESSSMYNFCEKNKDLTPLERWKIKRIQFGWNKKDAASENGEGETEAPAPSLEDVNLTAYQTWKLKQQKKHGGEENKDEILQMSRGEDAATVKRRQRRVELLERTRKTLEESQSLCGWETESALSTSIPLSAFCAGAFPSASAAGDDNVSVLSGRSSVLSGHSARSQPKELPAPPAPVTGPNGEPMVNIANIQNWITTVVNETLMQKQTEMMMMTGTSLAPSRAASVFSRGLDDDKASVLSEATSSSILSRCRAQCALPGAGTARSVTSAGGRAESVISSGGASNLSSLSSLSSSRKSKITTTSVPLYSLFQDQVNLHKLDSMEKEIKSDMRDKMALYEVKKIAEDNKRSTLYKKKKQKDEDEEHEGELGKLNGLDDVEACPREKPKPKRDFGRSGILNLPASVGNTSSNIDEWLMNVRPPCKTNSYEGDPEPRMSRPSYEEDLAEPSEFDFTSRRSSITVHEDEEENYSFTSRFTSRRQADEQLDLCRDTSPEMNHPRFQRSPPSTETSCNGLDETVTYRSRSSYTKDQRSTRSSRLENEDEEISSFIAQIRERARARVAEEIEDDEVLAAWRKQESHTDKS